MNLLKRKTGKLQAAMCPVCGMYMKKRVGIIIPVDDPIFTDRLHKAYCGTFWICDGCNFGGKA